MSGIVGYLIIDGNDRAGLPGSAPTPEVLIVCVRTQTGAEEGHQSYVSFHLKPSAQNIPWERITRSNCLGPLPVCDLPALTSKNDRVAPAISKRVTTGILLPTPFT